MGRRTKTNVPTVSTLLKVKKPINERNTMQQKKVKAAERHLNKRSLIPLRIGSTVRIQPTNNNKEWQQATVTAALNRRSYKVETDKRKSLTRNRQHLRLKTAPARVTNDVTTTTCKMHQSNTPAKLTPENSPTKSMSQAQHQSPRQLQQPTAQPHTIVKHSNQPEENKPLVTRTGRIVRKVDRLNL